MLGAAGPADTSLLEQVHTPAEAVKVCKPPPATATCTAALPTAAACVQAPAAAALQQAATQRHKPLHPRPLKQPQLKMLALVQAALNAPSHPLKQPAAPGKAHKGSKSPAVSRCAEGNASSAATGADPSIQQRSRDGPASQMTASARFTSIQQQLASAAIAANPVMEGAGGAGVGTPCAQQAVGAAGACIREDVVAAVAGKSAGGPAACVEAVAAAVQAEGRSAAGGSGRVNMSSGRLEFGERVQPPPTALLSAAGVGGVREGRTGSRTRSLATLSVQLPAVQRRRQAAVTGEAAVRATMATAAEQEGRPEAVAVPFLQQTASTSHMAGRLPGSLPATVSGEAQQLQATSTSPAAWTRPPQAAAAAAPRGTAASATKREVTAAKKNQQGSFFPQLKLYQHSPPRFLSSSCQDHLLLPKQLMLHCYPDAYALGQEVSLVVAVPREVAWLAREARAVVDQASRQDVGAAAAAALTSAATQRAIAEAAGGAQWSLEMTTTAVQEQQEGVAVLCRVHRQAGCRFVEKSPGSTSLGGLKRSLKPYHGWHLVFVWQVGNCIRQRPEILRFTEIVHIQRVSLAWDETAVEAPRFRSRVKHHG